jgi:intermediate cleaving peptidase 55
MEEQELRSLASLLLVRYSGLASRLTMRPRTVGLLPTTPARSSATPRLLPRPSSAASPRCLSSAPLAHPLSPVREPSTPGFGQPLPSTHPHLLAPGELTRGISADEYEQRRKRLMDGLEEGAVVIVAGGRLKYASGKILYVLLHSHRA